MTVAIATAYSLDWQRILVGEKPPIFFLEIVVRTALLMLYVLILLRFMGQRGVGRISLFEFALIIALGSAIGSPMYLPDVPVIHGMIAITVIMVFQQFLLKINSKSESFRRSTQGQSKRVVADGMIDLKGFNKTKLARHELLMLLREQGVEHLGQVRRAYFEIDGEISIYRFEGGDARPGLPLVPPQDVRNDQLLEPEDGDETGRFACTQCGYVTKEQERPPEECPRCHQQEWLRAVSQIPIRSTEKQSTALA